MTNNTAKKRISKAMEEQGVDINKITIRGISKENDIWTVDRIILSLDAPRDNDIANVLKGRQLLEEEGISLTTVLLEL